MDPCASASSPAHAGSAPAGTAPAGRGGDGVALPGQGERPALRRFVTDGWRDADPWPMGPLSRRALRGVVAALCPSPETGAPDTPPLAEVSATVCDAVRRSMRYLEWPLAAGLHAGLLLLDWAPLWRFAGLRPLHRLPPARAAAVVGGLAASRLGILRSLVMGARAAILMQWYDLPQIHERLAYAPVPFMRGRLALRERLLRGEAPTEADLLHPLVDELPPPGDAGPAADPPAGPGRAP